MRKIFMKGLWLCIIVTIAAFAFMACNNPANGGGNGGGDPVPVQGVAVSQATLSIAMGTTEQLSAIFTPTNATNRNVTWTSADPDIVTVSSTGLVSPVRVGGPVAITVTTQEGNFTATSSVTVVQPIALTRIEVSPNTLNITLGANNTPATGTVTITPTPANASDQVTWESSDPAIATAEGTTITARAVGTATLTARSVVSTNRTDYLTVTVLPGVGGQVPRPVTEITLVNWIGNAFTFPTTPTGPGSAIDPHDLTSTADFVPGTAMAREIQAIVSPHDATSSALTWQAHSPTRATLTTTPNGVRVTGHSVGPALFSVRSVTNPEIAVYFTIDVLELVDVVDFGSFDITTGSLFALPALPTSGNWGSANTFFPGLGDGSSATPFRIGTTAPTPATATNRGRLTVQLEQAGFPVGRSPSDLRIGFDIVNYDVSQLPLVVAGHRPPGGNLNNISATVIEMDPVTGLVEFEIVGNTGTGNLPENSDGYRVVLIRAFSIQRPQITSDWYHIRVLQPMTGITATASPSTTTGFRVGDTSTITARPVPATASVRDGIHNWVTVPNPTTIVTFPAGTGYEIIATGGAIHNAPGVYVEVTAQDYFTNANRTASVNVRVIAP